MTDPCGDCRGQGRKEETKTLSVKIPAGVDTGDRVRLTGEGEAGVSGGSAGDLYVQVNVKEHRIFKRDGKDLHCEVPIHSQTRHLAASSKFRPLMVELSSKFQTVRKPVSYSGCVQRG